MRRSPSAADKTPPLTADDRVRSPAGAHRAGSFRNLESQTESLILALGRAPGAGGHGLGVERKLRAISRRTEAAHGLQRQHAALGSKRGGTPRNMSAGYRPAPGVVGFENQRARRASFWCRGGIEPHVALEAIEALCAPRPPARPARCGVPRWAHWCERCANRVATRPR